MSLSGMCNRNNEYVSMSWLSRYRCCTRSLGRPNARMQLLSRPRWHPGQSIFVLPVELSSIYSGRALISYRVRHVNSHDRYWPEIQVAIFYHLRQRDHIESGYQRTLVQVSDHQRPKHCRSIKCNVEILRGVNNFASTLPAGSR